MRKVVLILVVLLMAAPAMAAVTITASQVAPGDPVDITYDCTGDDASGGYSLIAGMAFDISVDNGFLITSIGNFKTDGVSTNASPGFGIYMGSISILADPCGVYYIDDPGDPVADPCAPDSPGQIPGNDITIELGALSENSDDAPEASGILCSLVVSDPCGVDTATMTISLDDTRGGMVMTDQGDPCSINLPAGFQISAAGDCFPGSHSAAYLAGGTTTVGWNEYDFWVQAGKPDCWCQQSFADGYPKVNYQCKGDADFEFVGKDKLGKRVWVTGLDLDVVVAAWQKGDDLDTGVVGTYLGISYACADFNHAFEGKNKNGKRVNVTGADLDILVAGWQDGDDVAPLDVDCYGRASSADLLKPPL